MYQLDNLPGRIGLDFQFPSPFRIFLSGLTLRLVCKQCASRRQCPILVDLVLIKKDPSQKPVPTWYRQKFKNCIEYGSW